MSNFEKRSGGRGRLLPALGVLVCALLLATGCGGNGGTADSDDGTSMVSGVHTTKPAENDSREVTDSLATTDETREPTETTPGNAVKMEGKITVLDSDGLPLKDVIVTIKQGDKTIATKVTVGETLSVSLPEGTYTFTLQSPKGDFYYDEAACVLSPEACEITVTLCQKVSETEQLWIHADTTDELRPYEAAILGEGATYLPLYANDVNFFIFAPERAGVYEVTCLTDVSVSLGYYGNPVNVFYPQTLLDTVDGVVTLEVPVGAVNMDGSGQTGEYTFGLKPESELAGCIVSVKRVSDAASLPTEAPVQEYRAEQAKAYEGEVSGSLVDIDVTADDLTVVYNEIDGYYHYGTADGPIVFMRIDSASPYLDPLSLVASKSFVGCYMYDERGTLLYKESYHAMIDAYVAVCNKDGVVPLTPELEYMIKNYGGKQQKWWEKGSPFYLFKKELAGKYVEIDVPAETAWLFICCYYA